MKSLSLIIVVTLFITGNCMAQFAEFEKNNYDSFNHLETFFKAASKNSQLDDYDVKWYFLDLEADNLSTNIKGNVTILAEVVRDGMSELVVELASDMYVDSVIIDSQKMLFDHAGDLVTVTLINPALKGDMLECQVYYHGQPGQGVFNYPDTRWNFSVTWTLSEPFYAKNWFPCKQDLKDKADSVRIFITTGQDLMAGSNGLLKNISSMPGQKLRYEWYSNYPIVYYLVSFAISDYQDYSFYAHPVETDSILVQNFIYNDTSCLNTFRNDMEATSELIELYSGLFSKYPFHLEKYGHCLVPGGSYMEHQTMSTMKDFIYRIVAHELAHQWFGDQVTCSSWQDIWINEGFASYSEYIALQNLKSQEEADSWLVNAYSYALERPEGSVYVPFEESGFVGRIFDYRLTYKKGAAIIHMLRFELNNDQVFYDVLKQFQSIYKDSVASGLDFKEVAESLSGLNLTDFFDQWYFGKGYPYYEISWGKANDTLWINSLQHTSSAGTPLFKMPLEFRFNTASGDTIVRVFQDVAEKTYRFKMPDNIVGIELDPLNNSLIGSSTVTFKPDPDFTSAKGFKLYPNPANDHIFIDFYGNMNEKLIRVIGSGGQKVMEIRLKGPVMELDISNLSSGFYIIEVFEKNSVRRKQFIKI